MEFFSKKICCLCGKKAGLLGRQKIADSAYICGTCFTDCSDEITAERYEKLTKADVEAQLALLEKDAQYIREEFQETHSVVKGGFGKGTLLSVDSERGKWYAPKSHHGFVYDFDQIVDYRLELDTRYLTNEEREKRRGPGPMDFLMGAMFGGARDPRLPMCPPDHEITAMKVYIDVDHAYADQVTIPVMDALIVTGHDIEEGYRLGGEILRMLDCAVDTRSAAKDVSADALDAADAIKKYKELLDMGAITQQEYEQKKKQLLGL